MVIPGNPPSQLRVLHSSQQLYVSLYLASCCSSTNTLFLKTLKENSSVPLLFLFLIFLSFRNTSPFFLLYPPDFFSFSFLCISDLPSQWSLLQPHFFCHLFCLASLQPPFLSHSFYSFKKRGWFLMATKDVTRGPLG